jgi:uncharacterized protein (TIGR02996 family)
MALPKGGGKIMAADRQTQLGLIHNLVCDPDDDSARQVYADWLEERNDPLAELVRVQAEVRRAEAAGDPPEGLLARERGLLDNLGFDRPGRSGRESSDDDEPAKDWNHGVHGGLATLILHQTPPAAPAGWAERFGWYSIRYKCSGEFVYQFTLDQKGMRSLLGSPLMAGCVGLELSSLNLTTASVRLLANSPAVANLLRLDLRNNRLDAAAATALARSPHLKGLIELELSQNEIGDDGLLALAGSGAFPRLRRLRLSSVKGTAKGLAALFRSTGFADLRSLHVSHNRLDLRAARALARSTSFPELTTLDLGAVQLDDRRAAVLAESSGLPKLASLDLAGNEKLTDEGAVAVIRSPALAGLRGLELSFCPVGAPTVEALCSTGRLLRDGALRLRKCALTDEALEALAGSPAAAALRKLDLGGNAVTDAGARALAASPHLKGLRALDLAMCQVGPEGVRALTAPEAFPLLHDLSLEYDPVGDVGLMALARWRRARGVRELILDDAGITAEGVIAVVDRGDLRGLWRLGLGGNDEIGDEGIAALANCPDVAELRDLDIYGVGLTDEGARALIESPHLPAGLEICLFDHDFSDETEAALRARFAKAWV